MGGVEAFNLQLYGSGIYFSGQVIQGQIIVGSSTPLTNIKSIQVKLTGFASVHWSEQVVNISSFGRYVWRRRKYKCHVFNACVVRG